MQYQVTAVTFHSSGTALALSVRNVCQGGHAPRTGEGRYIEMRTSIILICAAVLCVPAIGAGQESHITLEENTWGNAHKEFNLVTIPDWIDSLVTPGSPLVVGKPGRSLTFADGSEAAILEGLPASGQPAVLPEGLGDAVVDSTCALPEGLPASKKGKLKNSLLGETMALALNARLDPELIDLGVCSVMMTVNVLAGPDELYGTEDDSLCATCDTMTVRIPEAVLAALQDSMGVEATVGSVLEFANMALAGEGTYDATLKGVWHAVKNINRGFKNYRMLVYCEGDTGGVPIDIKAAPGTSGSPEERAETMASAVALSVSSPVSDRALVYFTVPEASRVMLSVYNVAGREVAALLDGQVFQDRATVEMATGDRHALPSGVYFLRMTAVGVASGAEYRQTAKMLLVR